MHNKIWLGILSKHNGSFHEPLFGAEIRVTLWEMSLYYRSKNCAVSVLQEITETDLKVGSDTRRTSLRLSRDSEESTRISTRKRKSEQFLSKGQLFKFLKLD